MTQQTNTKPNFITVTLAGGGVAHINARDISALTLEGRDSNCEIILNSGRRIIPIGTMAELEEIILGLHRKKTTAEVGAVNISQDCNRPDKTKPYIWAANLNDEELLAFIKNTGGALCRSNPDKDSLQRYKQAVDEIEKSVIDAKAELQETIYRFSSN